MPNQTSSVVDRARSVARLDFPSDAGQPALGRVALAGLVSIVGSLVVDAILVALGKAIFTVPATFDAFFPSHYAPLTIVGIIGAAIAWPIVTRITSQPRWLYSWLAVAVTVVLLVPDFLLLKRGDPTGPVGILMLMHLAIAVITYSAVLAIAPQRRR